MVGFDLEHCKGCGICAAVCPVNAKVVRKAGEELARDDVRLCIHMIEEGSCPEGETMSRFEALSGNEAVATAMRQINPDVVAAYPITPQTSTVQTFADYVADGLVDTEFVTVESEHSAMSACVGASAAGARVMTATSRPTAWP